MSLLPVLPGHLMTLVEGSKSQVPEDEGISWLLWEDPPGGPVMKNSPANAGDIRDVNQEDPV